MISRTITKAPGVEGTSTESYLYDGLNRLTKGTNDVSVVERRYDSLSRLIEEVQDGKSVQYGYDKVGNPTSIRYPNQRLVEREFDLLNRISRVKQGSDVISTMEFLGRSYRLASKGYQNGDLVKYLYDQGRRLVNSETKNKNNAILQSFGWGYDVLDLKSFEKRIHSGGKGDAFSYDALKRLTNVTFDSPTPETPTATGTRSRAITLDKLDNILKITDNENAMVTEIIGELEGKGKALNQYSKFNDLPLEYDTNGNLSAKGSRLFAYDYQNRLIRSSKGDDAVTFTYDIFGRQTSRTDLSGTCHFFYAGDQKIEERNASGQVTKHYLWGNGIDELLRLDIYNGNSSTPYYVHTDNIGSTTTVTDENGNLVERVTYDVYGVPTFTNALGQTLKKSTIRNTTLFQGREYDYDLVLYNYRARYLDPSLGRFLQTDPLGYQDSMNLYQGMGMNPVNFIDPWGNLSLKKWLLGASEGFVNFALGIGNAISPQYSPFITSLNFTDPGQPVLITQIDKRSALDKLADLTIVKPTADYLVDLSVNAYFGVIANNINDKVRDEYQQGLSRNLGQLAGMVLTAGVFKKATTQSAATYEGYVYRRLSLKQSENSIMKNGIEARNITKTKVTPEEHVLGARESPWISTTRDFEGVAVRGYNNAPTPIAEIDLSKVLTRVVDLSDEVTRARYLRALDALYNAERDSEVLIFKKIPPEAIKKLIWTERK